MISRQAHLAEKGKIPEKAHSDCPKYNIST